MEKKKTNLDLAKIIQFHLGELIYDQRMLKGILENTKNKESEQAITVRSRLEEMKDAIKFRYNEIKRLSGVYEIELDISGIVISFRLYKEFTATWIDASFVGYWKVARNGKKPINVGALEKTKLAGHIRQALKKAGYVQSKHPLHNWGSK